MKNGAVVHGARDEVELQRVVDKLGVEVVVADRLGVEFVLATVRTERPTPPSWSCLGGCFPLVSTFYTLLGWATTKTTSLKPS